MIRVTKETAEQLSIKHDLSEIAKDLFMLVSEGSGKSIFRINCEGVADIETFLEVDDFSVLEAIAELSSKNLIRFKGTLVAEILTANYAEYLQSAEWKNRATAAKERAGRRCQVCNSCDETLDAHHRTYDRIGQEQDADLIVLCRSCHTIFHENGKLAR